MFGIFVIYAKLFISAFQSYFCYFFHRVVVNNLNFVDIFRNFELKEIIREHNVNTRRLDFVIVLECQIKVYIKLWEL
jgi:hypothetical protein